MTADAGRDAGLRQMLVDRRRESQDDGHASQGEVELKLRQMRADTRARLDAALDRLEGGTYGWCLQCERAIADRRLRVLPFTARCQDCDERREQERRKAHQRACGRDNLPLFSDLAQS